MRTAFGAAHVQPDQLTNKVADAYAEYLVREKDESPEALATFCEEFGVVLAQNPIVGHAYLDEDDLPKDKIMKNEYMDAHGLLLELQHERKLLTDKALTHVGIGLAANNSIVKVVELLSVRPIVITRLEQNESEGVDCRGLIIGEKVGLYASRIVSSSNMKGKPICLTGPPGIQLNKTTREFVIQFPGPLDNVFYSKDDEKYLEVYLRDKGDVNNIKYGVPDNERIKVEHLALVYRIKCENVPDPRTEVEDAHDLEMYQAEQERKKQ